jgi:5-methylcytosine-specific restriction endonuclease McrA
MTDKQFNLMAQAQGYTCALCHNPCSDLQIDHDHDHDHDSKKVRGLLCRECNTGLGKLGDNEAGLLRALEYVRRAAWLT